MPLIDAFAIILLAALIHASFQLSVSMLTVLNSHAIGQKISHVRLLSLSGGFLLGTWCMVALAVAFFGYVIDGLWKTSTPDIAWAIACGLMMGMGIAVWIFYYRKQPGTVLWLPRSIARYLMNRTKKTRLTAEAFGLGLTSTIGEGLFVIAPVLLTALVLSTLNPTYQLVGLFVYSSVSVIALALVILLVGSGHKLSSIQRWREKNKRFLQFISGSAMIALGFYIYVNIIIIPNSMPAGV